MLHRTLTVAPGKRMPTDLMPAKKQVWRRRRLWRIFLSHSCAINLSLTVSETSPKGNDSELSDRNGGRKIGVSRLPMLIG